MKLADIIDSTVYPNLEQIGIDSIDSFVASTETLRKKVQLASSLGLSVRRIDKWASMSRLVQIDGIGLEYLLLLTACNVYSIKDLAAKEADSLVVDMRNINRRKRIVRRVPATRYVEDWISCAQSMTPLAI